MDGRRERWVALHGERDALGGTAASAPGSGGRGGSVDDVLPAMSDEAIFEEVIVAPRKAFPPLPDLRVIDRPGWLQIVTPSINARVMAEGWGLELASLTAANRLIATSPGPRQRMFLARCSRAATLSTAWAAG